MSHTYNDRHWLSAAIALVGLFVFGYFYESLRQFLGNDHLLLGVALVFLFVLGRFGNYIGGKVSGRGAGQNSRQKQRA